MDAEHISKPIQRILQVLEIVYRGDDYDQAIEIELQRLGLREDQVGVIIAIPQEMAEDTGNKQMPLFS